VSPPPTAAPRIQLGGLGSAADKRFWRISSQNKRNMLLFRDSQQHCQQMYKVQVLCTKCKHLHKCSEAEIGLYKNLPQSKSTAAAMTTVLAPCLTMFLLHLKTSHQSWNVISSTSRAWIYQWDKGALKKAQRSP